MRRQDRLVEDLPTIAAILGECEIGRLGLSDRGQPYVVPLHFAYTVDDDASRAGHAAPGHECASAGRADGAITVYFHGADEGRKLDVIGRAPRACFEADVRRGTIDAPEAAHIGAAYASVVGFGEVRLVEDLAGKLAALRLLVERYAPGRGAELGFDVVPGVTVLAMRLDEVSAKRRDFPAA
jgi:nitroimidazol reductase NimA-like FMN-containing flavoprotein (pyridoxamine 5'-phosphate oxidase superfamily)